MLSHVLAAFMLFSFPAHTFPWQYAYQCVQHKETVSCREAQADDNTEACWCAVDYVDGVAEPFCQCRTPVDMADDEYLEYLIYWNQGNEYSL